MRISTWGDVSSSVCIPLSNGPVNLNWGPCQQDARSFLGGGNGNAEAWVQYGFHFKSVRDAERVSLVDRATARNQTLSASSRQIQRTSSLKNVVTRRVTDGSVASDQEDDWGEFEHKAAKYTCHALAWVRA